MSRGPKGALTALGAGVLAQRAAMSLAVVCSLVYAVSTVVRAPGSYLVWADAWVFNSVSLSAAVVCGIQGARGLRRSGGRPERARAWAWVAIAVGLTMTACGDTAYSLWVSNAPNPAYPSAADWFYLAFFPAMYVGLILLLREATPRFLTSTWLDGLVAGLGSAAVAWVLAFDQLVSLTGGRIAVIVVNLSYPVGDLLLIAISVTAVTVVGRRCGPQLLLLVAGLSAIAVADTAYALQVTAGTYIEGGLLDNGWTVSSVLIAWAALSPASARRPVEDEGAPAPWWSAGAIPLLFTLASVGVLTLSASATAGYLAAGGIVAAALRAVLAFREVNALSAAMGREARTDPLTSLANRRSFLEKLHAELARRHEVAVLLLDLDRFKEVNDALGHHAGDELLRQVSERISSCLRQEDLVARLGGDEFAVLAWRAPSEQAPIATTAEGLAQRVCAAMLDPFELDEFSLHVGVSIGVVAAEAASLAQDAAPAATRLMQRADVAMYDASPRAAATASTTRRATSTAAAGCRPPRSCALRWPTAASSWCSTTSRRSSWSARAWWASRRSCAGSTPSAG